MLAMAQTAKPGHSSFHSSTRERRACTGALSARNNSPYKSPAWSAFT